MTMRLTKALVYLYDALNEYGVDPTTFVTAMPFNDLLKLNYAFSVELGDLVTARDLKPNIREMQVLGMKFRATLDMDELHDRGA